MRYTIEIDLNDNEFSEGPPGDRCTGASIGAVLGYLAGRFTSDPVSDPTFRLKRLDRWRLATLDGVALQTYRLRCIELECLLQDCAGFVARAAQRDVTYGYPHCEDPRDFTPDAESCTAEEIAAHRAACEAWERGERPQRAPTHVPVVDGKTGEAIGHVTHAPWGIGSTVMHDEDTEHALALYARIGDVLRRSAQVKAP